MLRIFQHYRPRQIARYVRNFHRGQLYIEGVGEFEFDGGRILPPQNHSKRLMSVMSEVNAQIKLMAPA